MLSSDHPRTQPDREVNVIETWAFSTIKLVSYSFLSLNPIPISHVCTLCEYRTNRSRSRSPKAREPSPLRSIKHKPIKTEKKERNQKKKQERKRAESPARSVSTSSSIIPAADVSGSNGAHLSPDDQRLWIQRLALARQNNPQNTYKLMIPEPFGPRGGKRSKKDAQPFILCLLSKPTVHIVHLA